MAEEGLNNTNTRRYMLQGHEDNNTRIRKEFEC